MELLNALAKSACGHVKCVSIELAALKILLLPFSNFLRPYIPLKSLRLGTLIILTPVLSSNILVEKAGGEVDIRSVVYTVTSFSVANPSEIAWQ